MTSIPFPSIMGVINVTPDSFSDGGKHLNHEVAIRHGLSLIEQGADILDIGGESTRPGAHIISIEEELHRVIPVIQGIRKAGCTYPISIDTIKPQVAKAALDAGATIINDISGLDAGPDLARIAAEYNVPLILMHRKGISATMQQNPSYDNVVAEVKEHLANRCALAESVGATSLMIDIGIGFGKTLEHNWQLLKSLHDFSDLGCPMVLGISRKSFLGATLDIANAEERDIPTALLHALLLSSNVHTIRVHNVVNITMLRELYNRLNS